MQYELKKKREEGVRWNKNTHTPQFVFGLDVSVRNYIIITQFRLKTFKKWAKKEQRII